MELNKIYTIAGKPGLYKVLTHTKTGMIMESIIDKKRIPVYTSDKMSNLEDISVYTSDENVSLKDVFKKIHAKVDGGKTIDHKSEDKKLREYFEQILPEYDKDRVYISDIRKMFNWYNLLVTNDMLDLTDQPEEPAQNDTKAVESNEDKPEKPVKKAIEKKTTGTRFEKDKKTTK